MKTKTCAAQRQWIYTTASAVLIMVFALAGTAISAELYQWQDENGVVHFTDKPPVGKDSIKRRVKAPPTSGDENNEETGTDAEKKNADAARCDTERKRLQVLQSNMTVRMRNDDGSLRELSNKEMEEEVALSQAAIQRYCKPESQAQ